MPRLFCIKYASKYFRERCLPCWGANGAGKSTVLRAIRGLHALSEVPEPYRNRKKSAHEIAAAGMLLVPEGRQIFSEMSLKDNIRLGGWTRSEPVSEREIESQMQRFPKLRPYAQ